MNEGITFPEDRLEVVAALLCRERAEAARWALRWGVSARESMLTLC